MRLLLRLWLGWATQPLIRTSPSRLSTKISRSANSRPKSAAIRSTGFSLSGQVEHLPLVVPQGEMDPRQGQGDPREGLADVAELGLRRPHELPPHRRVVEEIVDLDGRAHRASAGNDLAGMSAGDFDFRPALVGRRAAAQHQPADLADRGQGLAAEPQRADAEQVVGLGELARGVGGDGQRQFFGRDAAAVVDVTRIRSSPPPAAATSIRVAPASTAFSINSLITLAGRSMTSPAAILLMRDWERRRMGMREEGLGVGDWGLGIGS